MKRKDHNTDYLFVYGTLLRDFSLPLVKQIENKLEWIGVSEINGQMYDLGEYPAILHTNNPNQKVEGEVYRVKDADRIFKMLDEYEGEEYKREKERIRLDSGETVRAWIYWYQQEAHGKRIRFKNYLNYLKYKQNDKKNLT